MEVKNKLEEKVVVEEKKLEPYFYQEIELKNPDDISYYQFENLLNLLESSFLGTFDQTGKYVIPAEITKQLNALAKVVEKKDGSKIYLKAPCGTRTFNFVMESGLLEKDVAYATLKLIEVKKETPFSEQKEYITPLIYYKDDADSFFEAKVKRIFNIVSSDDTEGRLKQNEELAAIILAKIAKMKIGYELAISESRLRDKIYIENILKIMEKDLKFGSYILRKYNEKIKELNEALDPNKKDYYRKLKQTLDNILLEEHKSIPLEIDEALQRLKKVYVAASQDTIVMAKEGPKKKTAVEEKEIKLKGAGLTTFKSGGSGKSGGSKDAARYLSGYNAAYDEDKKVEDKKQTQAKESQKSDEITKVETGAFYKSYEKNMVKFSGIEKHTIQEEIVVTPVGSSVVKNPFEKVTVTDSFEKDPEKDKPDFKMENSGKGMEF